MNYLLALLLAAAHAYGSRETIQDAVVHARKLLHGESVMTLASIFDPDVNPTLAGQPFAYALVAGWVDGRLTEYYADCSADGTPTVLLMDVEITTKNMKHGSPMSACIDATVPNGTYSKASLPRMNLNGVMAKLETKKEVRNRFDHDWWIGTRCFEMFLIATSRCTWMDPWQPGCSTSSELVSVSRRKRILFWRFSSLQGELTLGFGNVSFIGFLPIDLYRSVDLGKEGKGSRGDFHFITEQ
jgi:hypothetical protein